LVIAIDVGRSLHIQEVQDAVVVDVEVNDDARLACFARVFHLIGVGIAEHVSTDDGRL